MQNSPNQQDPDQDERKNSGMEDSTLMTIEFLRARLLSERSVSRTARLRADELAERVVELEEQLKIVSLQRKKAEKAASDVLSILENNGISEFSEDFDSTSDQEVILCESKVGNNSPEEEGSSVGSKMRRNHADDFYGSELESSPLPGRSLSWKSGKDSLRSHEKKYVDSPRRRSGSASTMSASARRRIGKSCRQLRRRETRSGVEESQSDNSMLAPQLNGIATFSEGFPTHSDIGPEILRESSEQDADTFLGGPVAGDLENQRTVANVSNYLKANGSDKDMERALEHQAQLIGQYVEEEKAQREWEEKFRENNSSTPDSCEPGNHSDITEERDEPKAHAPPHNGTLVSQDQEAKSKVEDIRVSKYSSKSQSNGFQSSPRVDLVCLQDQKSPASDFEFPVAMGKQDQQRSTKYSTMPPQSQNHLHSHLEVPTGNQSPQIVSSHDYSVTPPQSQYHLRSKTEVPTGNQSLPIVPSHMGSSLREGETSSGSKNEHRALVPHEMPDKLGSVLEALQQAKLSLQLKVNAFPPINSTPVGKAFESSVGGRPEVPVGSAGLFRVPSDFHLEAAAKATFRGSNSQLSLANYYPDAGIAQTAGDRITGPFTESSSSVSTGNRNLAVPTSLYMESRSRIQTWEPLETWSRFSYRNPFFRPSLDTDITQSSRHTLHDPNMDAALFASITYASPSYSYPDQMPWMPSDEGRRLFSTTGSGIPPNQMPRMPSDEGQRLFSTTGSGIPPNQMPRHFSTTGSDEGQRHFSTAGAGIPRNLMPQMPSDKGRRLFSTTGAGIPPNLMPRMPSDEGQQHLQTAGAAIPPSLMSRMPSDEGQRLFSTTGAGIPPNLLPRMPSDEGQRHFSTAGAAIPLSLMPRMPSDEGQQLFSTTGAGIPPSLLPRMPSDEGQQHFSTAGPGIPPSLMPRMPSDEGQRLFSTTIPPSNRFSFYDDHSRPSMPSGSYTSPAYSYPDRTPRMPSDERPPLFSSSGAGIPPPNRFSFYDDNIRPGMYR